jgi:hypothetical protein
VTRGDLVLPERGITLAEGWWADILYGGKDIENRHPSAAGRVLRFRGPLLLTASKSDELIQSIRRLPDDREVATNSCPENWTGPVPFTAGHLRRAAGMAVGIADVVDVSTPRTRKPDVFKAWGDEESGWLHLENPRPIEPFPCSGARGVWFVRRCSACGLVQGIEENAPTWGCRKCRVIQPTGVTLSSAEV